MNKKYFLVLTIAFILILFLLYAFSKIDLLLHSFSLAFLQIMNLVLFLLSILAYVLHTKAVQATNNFQFTTNALSITVIRMSVVVATIACFVLFTHQSINLLTLLSVFMLYFIYNFIELFFLLKKIKENKISPKNV